VRAPTEPRRYKAKDAWQSSEKAAAYRLSREPRRFTRYEREDQVIRGWLADLPRGARVLDMPCGTGRFIPLLCDRGFRYVGADVSLAMIEEARRTAAGRTTIGFVNADAEHMAFRDECVDCVIIWRLLHHIGDASIRVGMLREAARVTRSKVVVSFHHPFSFTHWRKVLQRVARGGGSSGHTVSQRQLKRDGESCGLRLVDVQGVRKYVSVNWFACFEKAGGDGPSTATGIGSRRGRTGRRETGSTVDLWDR
jgi:SAM-dependent methyltransferase